MGGRSLVLLAGDDLLPVVVPESARVLKALPPLPAVADPRGAVRKALTMPVGMAPLARLAGPGARVTVAFDDPSVLLPPPWVDPRRAALEEVFSSLQEAGVRSDDITLICANGLHRRWSLAELLPILGPRLLPAFRRGPGCRDAEDQESIRTLPPTQSGLLVEVSRHVTEADLVVYVGIPWTEMNGGHKSLACGLSTYRCIDQHHAPKVQAQSPLMEPEASSMHEKLWEIGRSIGREVPVLQLEMVVNNRLWSGPLRVLEVGERCLPRVLERARLAPAAVRYAARRSLRSSYQVTGVWAGAVEKVHAAAAAKLAETRPAAAEQCDILLLGLPNMSPYSVHSQINPILVANLALGYAFQFGRGRPLVREGGFLVVANPCRAGFHRRHHPSYVRFWEEVLPRTRESEVMRRDYQERIATDPELIRLYRDGQAFHPVHPFYCWYWMERARRHLGGVVFAGAKDENVGRMGFAAAETVEAALDLARSSLGTDASVAVQLLPPVFSVDVRGN